VSNDALALRDDHGKLSIHGFLFSEIGMERANENATLEQTQAVLSFFHRVNNVSQIAIGDLLNFLERKHKQTYEEVAKATGLAVQTCYNSSFVMRHIPKENRHPYLNFADYCAVASLEPEDQKQWLDKRVSGEIKSASRLDFEIHKNRPDPGPEYTVECPICGAKLIADTPVHLIGSD
jgi:hypothetical protein